MHNYAPDRARWVPRMPMWLHTLFTTLFIPNLAPSGMRYHSHTQKQQYIVSTMTTADMRILLAGSLSRVKLWTRPAIGYRSKISARVPLNFGRPWCTCWTALDKITINQLNVMWVTLFRPRSSKYTHSLVKSLHRSRIYVFELLKLFCSLTGWVSSHVFFFLRSAAALHCNFLRTFFGQGIFANSKTI